MALRISDEARQCLALFEDETGASARDCVVDDDHDRVLVLVEPGEMATAIGPGGQNVRRVERKLGRDVKLVEAADRPEDLVANALSPAAVRNVTISEGDDDDATVAYAEVVEADRGAAIGADGSNIDAARLLAKRHFGIAEIELT
jgi:N utilization substance protein A